MKDFIKRNAVFIGLSLAYLITLGLALLLVQKGDLHLWLCDRHTPAGDIFFRYYTHVAEWFPYALCAIILLFGRVGDAAFAASCQAMSALTTQIIKHLLNAPRPLIWFESNMPEIQLPLVDGVQMNHWLSFPSGHTTSFFALAFAASILATQKISKAQPVSQRSGLTAQWSCSVAVQLLLFVLAVLGGYSRIYLSQHFAMDVFGGSCVGLIITVVCYAIFSCFEDKKWYNTRLLAKE